MRLDLLRVLFMGEMLPTWVDRVLFIHSDLCFANIDYDALTALYETEMKGKSLGLVPNCDP